MTQMGTAGCNILKPTAVLTSDPVTIGWFKQLFDTTLGIEVAPVQQLWIPPQALPPALQVVINTPTGGALAQSKDMLT